MLRVVVHLDPFEAMFLGQGHSSEFEVPGGNVAKWLVRLRVKFFHADGSHGGWALTSVCLFVCLSVFSHDISKTDQARITKLDVQMFHDESWKLIHFGVKT